MRYSIKTMLVATAIVAMATWAVIWFLSPPVYTATLLNKTSLRTDAPQRVLSLALGDVHKELRLRHFAPASLLRRVLFSWDGPRIHVCRNLRRREPEQASDGHGGASDSWASSWVGLPSVKWKTRDQERGALFIDQILVAEFQAELFLLDQLDTGK